MTSLTATMWQARKTARALRDCTVSSVFVGWKCLARFRSLHKQIRKYSRQNKKQKLEDFLQEGAELALRHQTFDWFRRVRKLCPKQKPQRIQLFDPHGQPMLPPQELQQIEAFFGNLFHDSNFQPSPLSPLELLPFSCADNQQGLSRLPAMKALAPPRTPALIWKQFAAELSTPIYQALEEFGAGMPSAHRTAGWLDGFT